VTSVPFDELGKRRNCGEGGRVYKELVLKDRGPTAWEVSEKPVPKTAKGLFLPPVAACFNFQGLLEFLKPGLGLDLLLKKMKPKREDRLGGRRSRPIPEGQQLFNGGHKKRDHLRRRSRSFVKKGKKKAAEK